MFIHVTGLCFYTDIDIHYHNILKKTLTKQENVFSFLCDNRNVIQIFFSLVLFKVKIKLGNESVEAVRSSCFLDDLHQSVRSIVKVVIVIGYVSSAL